MIFNVSYDPAVIGYGPGYENSLHCSPSFQQYAVDLARRLVDTYGVRNGTVVEIGSGKGEFLSLLCHEGSNYGIGYDPSYTGESDDVAGGDIRFVPALWDGEVAKADLVCCRHVLEHLESPRHLVTSLAHALGGKSVIYVEVPDASYMLRSAAIYDVIYEHYSYFSSAPLRRLFADGGFDVRHVGTSFGDQYLFLEATRAGHHRATEEIQPPADLPELVGRFEERFTQAVETWADRLLELETGGRKVALWGSGSKGVTFLNVVPGGEHVQSVVDVNPRKHGRFIPGTGQEIVPPTALAEEAVDAVILMNPLYRAEIAGQLTSLGLSPELLPA